MTEISDTLRDQKPNKPCLGCDDHGPDCIHAPSDPVQATEPTCACKPNMSGYTIHECAQATEPTCPKCHETHPCTCGGLDQTTNMPVVERPWFVYHASGVLQSSHVTEADARITAEKLQTGGYSVVVAELVGVGNYPAVEPKGVTKGGWMAGDECGLCGSTNTYVDPANGATCRNCGGSDGDE